MRTPSRGIIAAAYAYIAFALLALALVGCRGGEGNQVDDLRNDLAEIGEAVSEGNYGRIYDEFATADCRQVFSREEFIALHRQQPPYSLTARRARGEGKTYTINFSEPEMIEIVGDTATFEIPFFFPEDQAFESFPQTFVKEGAHWRDTECLF